MCDRRYDVICKYLACAEKLTGGQLRLYMYILHGIQTENKWYRKVC